MPICIVQQDIIARDFVWYDSAEEMAEDKGYSLNYVRWVLESCLNVNVYQAADIDLYHKLKHRCTDIELMRTLSINKQTLNRLKEDAKGYRLTHFGRHSWSDLKKERTSNVQPVHAQLGVYGDS
jgi:hypothetical protein